MTVEALNGIGPVLALTPDFFHPDIEMLPSSLTMIFVSLSLVEGAYFFRRFIAVMQKNSHFPV